MAGTEGRGLRILCLDGGGVRGVVTLRILQNLKERTNKEPHQLFDLICGTSTGGIIALLLGVLKVPIDQCLDLFEDLSKKIFEVGLWQKAADTVGDPSAYRSETLEAHMKDIVASSDISNKAANLRLSEVPSSPRVFVVARRGPHAYLFRNYKDTADAGTVGTDNVCVWEAARATSAAPPLFTPVKVGRSTFMAGEFGHNNPTANALTEASRIEKWKGRPIAAIVSLGTGTPTYKTTEGAGDELKHGLVATATECEQTHQNLDHQRYDMGDYFRFNVSEGIGDLGLDETKFIDMAIGATEAYLGQPDVIDEMKACIRLLDSV